MLKDPQYILKRLIVEKKTFDQRGNKLKVTGTISLKEAAYLENLILENGLNTCLETGVAYGASTVAICTALSALESKGAAVKHYGVDLCQTDEYGGAAIVALAECGLDHIFELCEGPAHLMLPKLIERNVTVDFVFIDGMHTFDYTMIDLFFADKLLRPGGIICLHDMNMPSKKKAMSYLVTYRKYARLPSLSKPLNNRIGSAARELAKGRVRSAWYELMTAEPMATARKLEHFEPGWDFYKKI